jgi:uncharacterized protein (DUF2141 family)
MKKILTLVVCIFGLNLFAISQEYTVEFIIKNVKNTHGVISGALFSGEENFPDKGKPNYTTSVNASKGEVIIRFEDIPAGEYALAVLHDENNNKALDTNFIGFPKEGYGFSNNPRTTFCAPKYEDAKFRVSGGYYSALYLAY